jgi:hypothetical protein
MIVMAHVFVTTPKVHNCDFQKSQREDKKMEKWLIAFIKSKIRLS